MVISKKTITFQGFQRGPTIPGVGGPTFARGGGGVQKLISKETHVTCDFPGGGGSEPLPPLNPHMSVTDKRMNLIPRLP